MSRKSVSNSFCCWELLMANRFRVNCNMQVRKSELQNILHTLGEISCFMFWVWPSTLLTKHCLKSCGLRLMILFYKIDALNFIFVVCVFSFLGLCFDLKFLTPSKCKSPFLDCMINISPKTEYTFKLQENLHCVSSWKRNLDKRCLIYTTS